MQGVVEVEASSLEEAEGLALEASAKPNARNRYVQDTFEVDREKTERINTHLKFWETVEI